MTIDRQHLVDIARTSVLSLGLATCISASVYGVVTIVNTLNHRSDIALYANAVFFTGNMQLGETGEYVRQLQQRLNDDPRTALGAAGPGSPGNETDYFGPRTHAAVVRYQELYREAILAPVGLSKGTGFVGPSTRAHLNARAAEKAPIAAEALSNPETARAEFSATLPLGIPQANNLLASQFQDYDEVLVATPSRYDGPPGTKVFLSGFGFTREDNTVHLGDDVALDGIPSLTGNMLSFEVPLDVPLGKYDLYVSNAKGESGRNRFFIVTKPNAVRPTVTSVTPSEGFYGEEVTIHGSGFTPSGNEIRTGYGVIDDLASPDGTTITFELRPEVSIPAVQLEIGKDLGQDLEFPVWLYVVNENGVGTGSGTFVLKI